jgi:hypothetical protein
VGVSRKAGSDIKLIKSNCAVGELMDRMMQKRGVDAYAARRVDGGLASLRLAPNAAIACTKKRAAVFGSDMFRVREEIEGGPWLEKSPGLRNCWETQSQKSLSIELHRAPFSTLRKKP